MAFLTQVANTTPGNAFVRRGLQSEGDGFLKLGDIKGELTAASLIDPEYDELAGGSRSSLIDPEYDELAGGSPAGPMRGTITSRCDWGFANDALVHQVKGMIDSETRINQGINADAKGSTAGIIATYNSEEWFVIGSTVDSIGDHNSMGVDQSSSDLIGSISGGTMLAAANELRSDNRF